jgi:hypothetical protein
MISDTYSYVVWPGHAPDFSGEEFDWFGRDDQGCVAVFTISNMGYIPPDFFLCTVAQCNEFIQFMAARVKCEAIRVLQVSGDYRDWKAYAEHGLLACDYYDAHRRSYQRIYGYDLIYRPSKPMQIAEVPSHLLCCLPRLCESFAGKMVLPESELKNLNQPESDQEIQQV